MKCSLSDSESLSARIENLGNLGPEQQLDQTWRDLFGSGRPRRVCGDLLIKALGYRLQEKAIGGLKPSARRLLERCPPRRGVALHLPPGAVSTTVFSASDVPRPSDKRDRIVSATDGFARQW
jgi:hypothetical protein